MTRNFFRNKDGKLVIWQFPNPPLLIGLAFGLIAKIAQAGMLHTGSQATSTAAFFTWSYLELRYGESTFRRVLGAFVFAYIIASYFLKATR